jgi:hypothetical protein
MKPSVILNLIAGTTLLGYGAWKVYNHYNRAGIYKRKLILSADKVVKNVIDEMNKSSDDEIDDVTDLVNVNVIDSVDNSVVAKRRVRSRAPFRAYLVKIGKAKFGSINHSNANVLCVRKYLYDACIAHGVLARHICDNVDIATELVFVPTVSELTKLAIRHTRTVRDIRDVASILGVDSSDN